MFKGGANSYSEQIVCSTRSQVSKYLCAVYFACTACNVFTIKTFPGGGLIKYLLLVDKHKAGWEVSLSTKMLRVF